MTDLPAKPGNSARLQHVAQRNGGNRLTIAHLLLWMTTTALFMAITAPPLKLVQGYSDEQDASYQQQIRVLQYIIIAISPFAGAGIAAVVLAIWRRLKGGQPFPTQPGHWLLIFLGTGTSVRLLFAIIERMSIAYIDSGFILIVTGLGVSILLMAAVLIAAIADVREPARWRFTFQILAACFAALLGTVCCTPPFGGVGLVLLLFAILYLSVPVSILVAAARDLAVGADYDVFHWVGVVSATSATLIIFAMPFLPWDL
jgi:hypothetical protein